MFWLLAIRKTFRIFLTANSQQPTANSQQPTANSQQPTANSQQPTANSQQPTANSQQPTANSQQPTANSQQPTANSQMEFSQIKETCLYIKDLDQAESFYHQKLGLPIIGRAEGRYIFFRAGNSVLLCFVPEASKIQTNLPPHYGEGNLHLAFECMPDDYQSWKNKVAKAGIEIIEETIWKHGRKSFYFHDPERNVLEIIEPGVWDK